MKTSLDHLPENKRKEIKEILEIITKEAKPEKVILFGSHASGRWVEDEYVEDGITFTYISDYDFLVITKNGDRKESEIISNIENKCLKFKNAVSPIVHSIDYVNKGLRIGQYFFTDIIKEGIVLFDSGNSSFAETKLLTKDEMKERAQGYFEMWFPQGSEFLLYAGDAYERDNLRISAFLLHQATECFYTAVLLISTGYKPKTHNLQKLRNYAKHVSSDFYNIFDFAEEFDYHLFDLLKRGYVDARYRLDYVIQKDELQELIKRINKIKEIVENIYNDKMSSFD